MPRTPEPQLSLDRCVLLAILLVAAGLRIHYLDQAPRYDEADTFLRYVQPGPGHLLSHYEEPNNHVFHNIAAWLSIQLFGPSLWSLRLPALLAGLALCPAVYLLGRRWLGSPTGLWAAALVATHPPLVEFSTNARGYTLQACFTIISVLLLERWRRQPEWSLGLLWAATTTLALWTLPTSIYTLFAGVLAALYATRHSPHRVRGQLMACTLIALAGATLAYLPILLNCGWQALGNNAYVKALPWPEFLKAAPSVGRTLLWFFTRDLPTVLTWAALLACLLAGVVSRPWRRALPWLWAFVISVVAITGAKRVIPFERNWIFLYPLLLLLIAGAGTELLRRMPKSVSRNTSALQVHRSLPQIIALALLALGAWACLAWSSVRSSSLTGSFHEVRLWRTWIHDHGPEANYLASIMSSTPLRALSLLDPSQAPVAAYNPDNPVSYLAVQRRWGETVEYVLKCNGIHTPPPPGIIECIGSLGETDIYRCATRAIPIRPSLLNRAATRSADGQVHCPWFGTFRDYLHPWIEHREHGWLYVTYDQDNTLELYDKALEIFFLVSPDTYPRMRVSRPGCADLRYLPGGQPGQRQFIWESTGEILDEAALKQRIAEARKLVAPANAGERSCRVGS